MLRVRLLSWLLLASVAVGGLTLGVARLNASTPQIHLQLPTEPAPASNSVDVPIRISGAVNLGAWEFDLVYDPAFLTVQGMTINPAFGTEFDCNTQSQRCAVSLGPVMDKPGTANIGAISYGQTGGLNGEGTLAVLHLIPTGQIGSTVLSLHNALVTSINAQPTIPTAQGGTLILREAAGEIRLFLPSVTK
jgi:hypothetical protein